MHFPYRAYKKTASETLVIRKLLLRILHSLRPPGVEQFFSSFFIGFLPVPPTAWYRGLVYMDTLQRGDNYRDLSRSSANQSRQLNDNNNWMKIYERIPQSKYASYAEASKGEM